LVAYRLWAVVFGAIDTEEDELDLCARVYPGLDYFP
jgi:hypothetical protein